MKLNEIVLKENLDIIDNRNGLGQVPNNQDIDYMGTRTTMTPNEFLFLSQKINTARESLEAIIDHIENGGKIGAPFLHVVVPDEWLEGNYEQPAYIQDHEGRHRMMAVRELYGENVEVETHLFFHRESSGNLIKKLSNDIKDEWSAALSQGIVSQDNRMARMNILLR